MNARLRSGRNWVILALVILSIPGWMIVYVLSRSPYMNARGIIITVAVGLVVGFLFYLMYRGKRFILYPLTALYALYGISRILTSTRGMAEFYAEIFLVSILEGLLFIAPFCIMHFMPSVRAFLRYQRSGQFEDHEMEERIAEIGKNTILNDHAK
ncbi:MAG: hypothetical protein AAF206_16920 [Bacteroidota bacterium]